ncbi:MAG: nucleotidyltransferase domain-containing protein [Terracidiphilus sp.]|jgi:type I restriction enzyme S subunit
MKPPTIDIRSAEWEIVSSILERHVPCLEVWAFGSRVKGTAKPFSDLDLAILGSQPLTLSTLAELADDFSESDLPFKVDIVDWATTSERFRKVIEEERVVLRHPLQNQQLGDKSSHSAATR